MIFEVGQATESVAAIERLDLFDLVGSEGEVENVEVRFDSLRCDGLWNGYDASVDLEPQQDGRGRFAVFRAHLLEQRMLQQRRLVGRRPVAAGIRGTGRVNSQPQPSCCHQRGRRTHANESYQGLSGEPSGQ